jgi:hypothetical protein
MKFDSILREYIIQTETKDKPGTYMIEIKLIDEYGIEKLYSFKVILQPRVHSFKDSAQAIFRDATPLVARLREVSLKGVAKIKFLDKIKVPVNYTNIINE